MMALSPDDISLRYTTVDDADPLKQWLLEPGVLQRFPMDNQKEVEDAVYHWIGFSHLRSSLTAVVHNQPAGIATLCLMPYKKLAHQCLISLIVTEKFRNQGVGTVLLNNLIHLAKEKFALEVLYLEVYDGNPAISLYRRFGFHEVGSQQYFMKEQDVYVSKIIMEKVL